MTRDPRKLVPALLLAAAVAVSACSRPLSVAERGFAQALFGPSLNTDRIQVSAGLGLTPLPGPRPFRFRPAKLRPSPCGRAEPQPRDGPPPAFVLFERMFFSQSFYTPDAMAGWPRRLRVPHALVLAHELTHVWQWQNRDTTGYDPRVAFNESMSSFDPYFYRLNSARPFFDYGFEQQASLIEDYVCYRLLDPGAPEFARLTAILAPVFPLAGFETALATGSVPTP